MPGHQFLARGESLMDNTYKLLDEAVALLRRRGFGQPRVAVILGSGLGTWPTASLRPLPSTTVKSRGLPLPTVPGHAGRLVFGAWEGVSVVAMQGRYHGYEGYSQRQIAFALWTLAALGAKSLLVTNAAGGLNPEFRPGDLMLIADHINFTGGNPLIGPNPQRFGPRFPDLSRALLSRLRRLPGKRPGLGIPLREGVYWPSPALVM